MQRQLSLDPQLGFSSQQVKASLTTKGSNSHRASMAYEKQEEKPVKKKKMTSAEFWFYSDRRSSLQDVITKVNKIKNQRERKKNSDTVKKTAGVNDLGLKRKNCYRKDAFLRFHDKRELYHVSIQLSALIVSPDCPLLGDFEEVIVRIERGQMSSPEELISLVCDEGAETLLEVNMELNLQTRLFQN